MLTELLNKLKGREATDTAALEDLYVFLLTSEDHSEETVEELRVVMKQLGKSADDAAADARILTHAGELATHVTNGSGLLEKLKDANQIRDDFANESQRIITERQQKVQQLSNAARAITERRQTGRDAADRLNALAKQYPNLLRTRKVPAYAD